MQIDQTETVLEFADGSNAAATLAASEELAAQIRTIEAWIAPTSVDETSVIAGFGPGHWELGIEGGHFYADLGAAGRVTHSAALAPGEWTHVAAAYDAHAEEGQRITLVVGDANPSHTLAPVQTTPAPAPAGLFTVGERPGGGVAYRGKLARLTLWGLPRTPQQLVGGRFLGAAGAETGLIAAWPFGEGSGTTATDASAARHVLSLPASIQWVAASGLETIQRPAATKGATARFLARAQVHVAQQKADTQQTNAQKLSVARHAAGKQVKSAHARAAKKIALSKFEHLYYEGRDGLERIAPNGTRETLLRNNEQSGFVPGGFALRFSTQGTEAIVASKTVPPQLVYVDEPGGGNPAVPMPTPGPVSSIACDAAGELYWISGSSSLFRTTHQRSQHQRLAQIAMSSEDKHWPIVLDEHHRFVYWSNSEGLWRHPTDQISDAASERVELVLARAGLGGDAIALDIDGPTGKVYWIARSADGAWLRRANLDGSAGEDLYAIDDPGRGLAVDAASNQIFWTDSVPRTAPTAEFSLADEPISSQTDAPRSLRAFGSPKRVTPEALPAPGIRHVTEFDGQADYLESEYFPEINAPQFTFSVYARVTGGAGTFRAVLSSRDDYPQRGFILYAGNDNRWQFWIGAGPGFWQGATGPDVVESEWVHLAGVYDGERLSVFANGERIGAPATIPLHLNLHRPLRIGAGRNESPHADYFFHGQIADLKFWDRALPDDEVAGLSDAHQRFLFRGAVDGIGETEPLHAIDARGVLHLDSKSLEGQAEAIVQAERLRKEKAKAAAALHAAHDKAGADLKTAHASAIARKQGATTKIETANASAAQQRGQAQARLKAKKTAAAAQRAHAQTAASHRRSQVQGQANTTLANAHAHAKASKQVAQRDLDAAHRKLAAHR